MKIETWRDPYDAGFSPTKPKEIELNSGLTVLVGCNGAGKSTLLLNIKEYVKGQNIPCYYYDNLSSGRDSVSSAIFNGNIGLGATLMTSSEGECIKLNLQGESGLFDDFLKDGVSKRLKFNIDENVKEVPNIRVMLFDALDSGLSVDSIMELRIMCNRLLERAKEFGVELYIIISANEYELARKADCFDVNRGKYITFNDYEDYRKFIIKTREDKEKRIKRQEIWYENKKQREEEKYNRLVERDKAKIESIKSKAEGRNLTYSEKYRINDLEREIRNEKPSWLK